MFGLEADTVEYGEWKSGQRSEGATYAVFSFTRKITQSIGGALGAAALALGGYLSATAAVPNPVQPDSAILAIQATIGLIPAIAAFIAMLIFWKYPLTDQRFREIRNETEAASASRATSSPRTDTSSRSPQGLTSDEGRDGAGCIVRGMHPAPSHVSAPGVRAVQESVDGVGEHGVDRGQRARHRRG